MYIYGMKRTTIFLTDEQVKKLAKVAARKGLNVAQLIRLYVSEGLRRERE
jgi:predicted DNA-binding ribbon-helix-helix protein